MKTANPRQILRSHVRDKAYLAFTTGFFFHAITLEGAQTALRQQS
jgi:hypothetical protein